jgi:hypothetical protein
MKLAIVLVLVFILSSCTNVEGPSRQYVGGAGGLVFSFEDGAPPSVVQDAGQTPMALVLRVENTGEYDLPEAVFTLSGISANDFSGFSTGPYELSEYHENELQGKALVQDSIVEGQIAFLDLNETSYARPIAGSSLEYTLNAKACYPYATSATATVCLASDYYSPRTSCDPNSASISTSAAPITISNIETSPAGSNRLRVSFDVAKSGTQQIWAPHPDQTCPNDRQTLIQEGDRVYIRIDGFGNAVSCTSLPRDNPSGWDAQHILDTPQQYRSALNTVEVSADGFIRLSGGRARVQCTLDAPADTDARGTIDIVAAYYVEDSIAKPFTVERSGVTN